METKRPSSGALWERTSKKGATFMSGYLLIDKSKITKDKEGREIYPLICFENYKRENPKSPKWNINYSEPLPPKGEMQFPKEEKKESDTDFSFPAENEEVAF